MTARPSLEVRRDKFAAFIRRALDDVRIQRGWNQTKVLQESGIGRTTLHRWSTGNWTEEPKAATVRDFCDALDISPVIPFLILWPGRRDRPQQPEPAPIDPDFEQLLRRLVDPAISEAEKYHIRETVRSLAGRAPRRDGRGDRAS